MSVSFCLSIRILSQQRKTHVFQFWLASHSNVCECECKFIYLLYACGSKALCNAFIIVYKTFQRIYLCMFVVLNFKTKTLFRICTCVCFRKKLDEMRNRRGRQKEKKGTQLYYYVAKQRTHSYHTIWFVGAARQQISFAPFLFYPLLAFIDTHS